MRTPSSGSKEKKSPIAFMGVAAALAQEHIKYLEAEHPLLCTKNWTCYTKNHDRQLS